MLNCSPSANQRGESEKYMKVNLEFDTQNKYAVHEVYVMIVALFDKWHKESEAQKKKKHKEKTEVTIQK